MQDVRPPTTDMKLLLKETILLFINNFQSLLKIAFPLLLVTSIADFYAAQSNGNTIMTYGWWIVSLSAFCLLSSSLIIFLSQSIHNQNSSTKYCVIGGIIYVPYIFLIYIVIYGPFVVFAKLLWPIYKQENSLFFIIAVIFMAYVAIKTSFATYFIVLEEEKPIPAIKKSFHYTKGFVSNIMFATFCLASPISIMQITYEIFIKDIVFMKHLLTISGDVTFSFMFVLIHIVIFKIFYLRFTQYNQQINTA